MASTREQILSIMRDSGGPVVAIVASAWQYAAPESIMDKRLRAGFGDIYDACEWLAATTASAEAAIGRLGREAPNDRNT